MMRLISLFSLCVAAVTLGGCQTGSPSQSSGATAGQTADTQALTVADNGKTVGLSVGETFSVSLQGNASTGYSWALSENGTPVVALAGSPVSTSHASAPEKVGAPETTTWTFAAKQAGEATLRFEYRRPWEKDVAPTQTFAVTIKVAE